MKNRYIIFLSFIIILLYSISCAPVQQPTTTAKPGAVVNQPAAESPAQPKQEVSADVKEVLDKPKTRVKSIYYKYKGPKTGDNFYDFYVKGTKIKYMPALETKTLDRADSYDTIFIDTTAKTAQSYCVAAYCAYKGKKADLNYDDAYISTVFDWVSGLTQAAKVGEEVIDDRSTWKIDTNKGTLWVDSFYGIPLKVESSGKIYRFQQIAVNSVQDTDVMP